MGIPETLLLYLVIGMVVAAASLLLSSENRSPRSLLLFVATVPFWPLFAPFVLTRSRPHVRRRALAGGLSGRIDEAELLLMNALTSLGGIAEEVLAPEVERVRGLGNALRRMADRAAEMDRLLHQPEFGKAKAEKALEEVSEEDPRARSIRARIANIDRLESMRSQTLDSLERALSEVEEIGSRTALLKFADCSEEAVVEMIREIAFSVEGAFEGLQRSS